MTQFVVCCSGLRVMTRSKKKNMKTAVPSSRASLGLGRQRLCQRLRHVRDCVHPASLLSLRSYQPRRSLVEYLGRVENPESARRQDRNHNGYRNYTTRSAAVFKSCNNSNNTLSSTDHYPQLVVLRVFHFHHNSPKQWLSIESMFEHGTNRNVNMWGLRTAPCSHKRKPTTHVSSKTGDSGTSLCPHFPCWERV